jgi:hypothetical protein
LRSSLRLRLEIGNFKRMARGNHAEQCSALRANLSEFDQIKPNSTKSDQKKPETHPSKKCGLSNVECGIIANSSKSNPKNHEFTMDEDEEECRFPRNKKSD